jgi:protocatechuate 3,4-dioxygenase beta subunit
MSRKAGLSRRELLAMGAALPLGALAVPDVAGASGNCGLTSRQTSGPFFPTSDQSDKDVDLTQVTGRDGSAEGEAIRVQGRVLDVDCNPVEGALVDLWQANARGRYSHPADRNPTPLDPNFQGWGQAVTDADGRYSFRTIKPGAYALAFLGGAPDDNVGYRTPHLHFRVSKRGYSELTTQMYFSGESRNETDRVLMRVALAERPRVVIAAQRAAAGEAPLYVFDLTIGRA